MIDLRSYLEQLSTEELKEICNKYEIKLSPIHLDRNILKFRIINEVPRETMFFELFKAGRAIQVSEDALLEISEEFHISDTSYSYLRERILSPNPRIRANAIKGLVKHHPDKSFRVITEVLTHENSLYVFANTWSDIESTENEEYRRLLDKILAKFSKLVYNLDLNEVKFLLDNSKQGLLSQHRGNDPNFEDFYIHCDFGGLGTSNLSFSGRRRDYKLEINPTTIHYRYLHDPISGNEIDWISIYRGHISGLITYAPIPESIRYLKRLKLLHIHNMTEETYDIPRVIGELRSLRYLSISNFNIGKLPDFTKKLTKLRHLNLNWVNLDSIPQRNLPDFIKELTKLRHLNLNLHGVNLDSIPQWVKIIARKYHSRPYIKEGVVANDAFVLGLLEILLGEKIQNYKITIEKRKSRDRIEHGINEEDLLEDEQYFDEDPFYYKTNENGRVTEIVIAEICGEHVITILPEEIITLDALEELTIQCRDLRVVADSIIKKFPYLEDLIECNKNPIPRSPISFLRDCIFDHLQASIMEEIFRALYFALYSESISEVNRVLNRQEFREFIKTIYAAPKKNLGIIDGILTAVRESRILNSIDVMTKEEILNEDELNLLKDFTVIIRNWENKNFEIPDIEFFERLRNELQAIDSEQPPVNITKAEEETPFQLDEAGTKQYLLDGFLKHDKEAQDYAKDIWSIMENPQLTEKEKMDLVRKSLAKFEEELERRKQKS